MAARSGPRSPREVAIALAVTLLAAIVTWVVFKTAGDRVLTARRDEILPVLLGVAVLIVALPWRLVPYGVAAAAGAWTIAHLGVKVFPDMVDLRPPVDQAVGGAAFTGTDYQAPQIGIALAAAGSLAAAALASYVLARRGRSRPAAEPAGAVRAASSPPPDRGRRDAWLVVAGILGLALVLVPEIGTTQGGHAGVTPGWDLENIVAWEWAVDRGLSPMNDFFFPYGETWVFYEFPSGPVWEWLSRCGTLAFAAWAMWRLGPPEGRATRAVLAAAVLLVLAVYSTFYWRYGLAVLFVAGYAATGPGTLRRPGRDHAILALAATYIALYDVGVLAQAAVGCAFVFAGELIARRVTFSRQMLRGVIVDLVPFVAAAVALFLVWAVRGSLEESLRWWASARATSAASAPNEAVEGALTQHIALRPTLDMLFVGAPFLLLGAGLVHAFSPERRSVAVSRLLMGAAGASVLFLFKHMVRPQSSLTLVIPLLALCWCALLLWNPRRLVVAAVVGAFAAALAFSFESGAGLTTLRQQVTGIPDRVQASFDVIGDERREQAIDRERFELDPAVTSDVPNIEFANTLRTELARSPDRSFAVLGDAQALYYALGQRPPFHVQLYNSAPIEEQEAVVDDLEDEQPRLLFWRRDVSIDGVPQAVRAPIVMRYAIEHYVPARSFAEFVNPRPYEVLVRRRPGQPITSEWWRRRLGVANLGFVPYASTGEDAESCTGGEGCARYLVARRTGATKGPVTFNVLRGRRMWQVQFDTKPGEDTYPVRMDRLWFAPFAGPRPTIQAPAGWRITLEGRRTDGALY